MADAQAIECLLRECRAVQKAGWDRDTDLVCVFSLHSLLCVSFLIWAYRTTVRDGCRGIAASVRCVSVRGRSCQC